MCLLAEAENILEFVMGASEQYKNKKFSIVNDLTIKANGLFECYNVTENMIHLARLGKDGKKLTPNSRNLLNVRTDNFELGLKSGFIVVYK